MKRRRVKITGIGPVTPAGIGCEEFWRGILEPISRARPYTKLAEEYGSFVAASIEQFDIGKYVDRGSLPKGAARHTQFAIAGAILAIKDAGLSEHQLRDLRVAVITGSSLMDFGGMIRSIDGANQKGTKGTLARTIHTTGVGSVPSAINYALGLSGRTVALSNQCSSGMDAVGYAAAMVANGEVDIAICGGTDAPLHRSPMLELRAGEMITSNDNMPDRQARPFDLWRNASVVGEGCAMLILEPETSERRAYSYILGYGFANDSIDDICSGMVEASRIAMGHGCVRPGDIEVLNAWGPGDKRVDVGEVRAMEAVFGVHLNDIAAVSIKGAIGSAMGAAPAIQVATAALGQRFGMIPPTVNWDFADPACRLNLSNRARSVSHTMTMVNSHGMGAVNGSIILGQC